MIMHEDPVEAEITAYDGYAMDLIRRVVRKDLIPQQEIGQLVEDYCKQDDPDNWALTNIEVTYRASCIQGGV